MVYNELLAQRISFYFSDHPNLKEKRMFGGIAFMVNGNMTCGVIKNDLMARIGPDFYEKALSMPYVREMDFTKRPMKGMIYVSEEGIQEDKDLHFWIEKCLEFTYTLPEK